MRKKLIGILFCMLMIFAAVLPVAGVVKKYTINAELTFGNANVPMLIGNGGTMKHGFIIGPFDSSTWDGDLLVLNAAFRSSPYQDLTFVFPFRCKHLFLDQQIKLAKSNFCIILKNFIIGLCKIYIPKSEISMHVLSQNDSENKVTWVVDEINGDNVWENNIDIKLYTESGNENNGSFMYGPLTNEYLSVGDQIDIRPVYDGYYSVKFTEIVSGDIIFESPLVKY